MCRFLLGILVLATAGTAMGNDVWVVETGTHYLTIQAAIDAATAGQTVQVAAGTYGEAIAVGKAIALQGAGRDVTTIDATGAAAAIAVDVANPGGNMTLTGFTVKSRNSHADETFGICVTSNAPGTTVTITNCRIQGTNDPDALDYGLYVHGSQASLVFQGNIVTATSYNPILIEKNPGATEVSGNTIDAGPWGSGCFYMTYGGTDVTTLQKFSDNSFDLGTGGPFDYDHRVEAVSFTGALWGSLGSGGYSNVEIKNNHIYNGRPYRRGIGLWNDDPGDGSGGLISNAVIENNVIEGLNPANEGSHGLRLAGKLQNVTIQCNSITGMKEGCTGLAGWYGSHYPESVTLSADSLVGNGLAINWPSSATQLNSQGNWWGSASGPGPVGPGSGDKVSENVDYASWLTMPPSCEANLLYLQPNAASIYVKPTETVLVDLNVANLQQEVTGMQALLNFDSTYFRSGGGDVGVVPGGGVWNELIYDVWTSSGDLDVAVGVDLEATGGTQADATTAKVTLTPTGTEGVTRMVFRTDGENGYATMLSDTAHQPVWPSKLNSTNIYIDGTPPNEFAVTPSTTCTKTDVTLTFSTTDGLSGIDHCELLVDTVSQGTVTSPHVLDMSGQADGAHQIVIRAWDRAGNTRDASVSVSVDKTGPTVTSATASPTCVKDEDVTITAAATDTGCAGGTITWEYRVGIDGTWKPGLTVPAAELAEGSNTLYVRATDGLANTGAPFEVSTPVSRDTAGPTVDSATASPTCVKDEDVTITAAATDTGCAGGTITWEYRVGIDGTWKPGLTVPAAELAEGVNTLYVRATDGLANTGAPFEVSTPVSKDTTPPVIASITATQNGGNVLCPDLAIQGVVDIYVTLADDGGCAALQEPTVIVDGISPTTSLGGSGNTWHYQVTVTSTTANGTHAITVTASDSNGNTATDDSEAICVDKNQAVGTVSFVTLSSAPYSFTRDVVFVATDSSGTGLKTWTIAVVFTNDTVNHVASGTYVLLNAPETTAKLSAKTAWHLRKRQAATLDGDGQVTADFALLGGDLDGSNYVNILDYSILKGYWNSPDPLADINGDGQVQLLDYSIMKSNWFKPGDPQ